MDMRAPAEATTDARAEPDDERLLRLTDGVQLATDVYLPQRRTAVPAVLLRTPYDKRGDLEGNAALAGLLTAAGFAVVVQDVRGRYASTGSRTPFQNEVYDGFHTLDWIAGQPWSDGRVIPMGDSYAGFTAMAAAASRHPTIRAVVARVTTTHIGEEWLYRQGNFRLQMNAQWAAFAWGGQRIIDVTPDYTVRPLADLDLGDADTSHLLDWRQHPVGHPAWVDRDLAGDRVIAARVEVPTLHWSGWWDLFSRGQIRGWRLLAEQLHRPGQRLFLTATDHMFNTFDSVEGRDGSIESQPLEQRYAPVLEFLQAVTSDMPEVESGVHFEVTHDRPHDATTWPPPSAKPELLYLRDGQSAPYGPEGGALSPRPDRLRTVVSWHHDPEHLVPSLETFIWGTLAADFPDERDAHVRDDVLTFTTAAADRPWTLAGNVEVAVTARASAPTAQLMATLCDVYPDGRAVRIAEGASRITDATTSAMRRIELGPLAYQVRAGHRLRLALAASAFPRYLWHVDGQDPWTAQHGDRCELFITLGDASYVTFGRLTR